MTNWQTGDVITAEKLNDLESRASGFIVMLSIDETTGIMSLDKTWQEIHDAMAEGVPVRVMEETRSAVSTVVAVNDANAETHDDYWSVTVMYRIGSNDPFDFTANSANEYPTFQD